MNASTKSPNEADPAQSGAPDTTWLKESFKPETAKKWWQKDLGEWWFGLLRREKTRWIAVGLFLAATVVVNWIVFDAAREGTALGRFGDRASAQGEPVRFSLWVTWHTVTAVIFDLIVLWAVIAAWKGRKAEKR
jgi:hypothetical protein